MNDIYDFKDARNTIDFYEEATTDDYISRVKRYANHLTEDYIRGKEQYNIMGKPKEELFPVRPVEYPNEKVMVGWPKMWQEAWKEMVDTIPNQNKGYDNKVLKDIIVRRFGKDAFPKQESALGKKTQLLSEKRKRFAKKQLVEKLLENNKKLLEALDLVDEVITNNYGEIKDTEVADDGLLYVYTIRSNYPIKIYYSVDDNDMQLLNAEENCIGEYSLEDDCIEDFYEDLKNELAKTEDLAAGYWDEESVNLYY